MGSRAEIGTVDRCPPASKSSLPLPLPCRPLRPFGCRKLIRPRGGECARFKFELLCLYVRIFGPVSIWPSFPPSSPLHILEIRATCNELRMGRMGKRGKCYPVRNKSTFILPGNKPGNAATCPAVQFSMRAKRGEHFSFLSFFFAYFNQFDRIELCANLKMNRVKI